MGGVGMKCRVVALFLALCWFGRADAADYVCGQTGFNSNVGAGKTFRCAPVTIARGVGVLTFNATSTVTVSPAGFQGIVPPEAVPGADGIFFRVAGLMAIANGNELHFLNITAKASGSSITALLGGVAVGFSDTTTRWAHWSTTCYRSAVSTNDPVANKDPRVWAMNQALTRLPVAVSVNTKTGLYFAYTQATSAASNTDGVARPVGLGTDSAQFTAGITIFSGPTSSAVARTVTFFDFVMSTGHREREFQLRLASAASDTFVTLCIYAPSQ